MEERHNTIVCEFDRTSPRITAFQIHQWIFESLRLAESDIRTIQIDGPRRLVYIKFNSSDRPHAVITATGGSVEYRHDNGELSMVNINMAGMGIRRIRLAGLAPEVKDQTIRDALSTYGDVREVYEEKWSNGYPYRVYNGVRNAMTNLRKHLPSHLIIAGSRALISYEGQPPTCYGCNEQGHINQDCPRRRQIAPKRDDTNKPSWANIVIQRPMRQQVETLHDTESSQQEQCDTDKTGILHVPQPLQTVPLAPDSIADEVTYMDSQEMESEVHKPEQVNREALEAAEMTDIPIGFETLDTIDTQTHKGKPMRDSNKAETGNTKNPPDRITPREQSSDDEQRTGEVHTPHSQMSSLRPKKLKTERDDPANREKKRSRSRIKVIHK